MSRIDVAVLGRPHVSIDGVPIALVGRQLALALRLATTQSAPVPLQRLVDVWPDAAASDGAIRVALTRLRRSLGSDHIVRVDEGYLLSPSARVDAEEFETLLVRARDRSRSAEHRQRSIDEALSLWNGPAYGGLEGLDWVDYERVRLDELREHARDVRFELLLERGEQDAVIGELFAESARTPDREHRSELLAHALYRSGRQADALGVIAALRTRLRDDLGLDPGSEIVALERRILTHDPSLIESSPAAPLRPDDPRLRAATALLKEGITEDALRIADRALVEARHRNDGTAIASALLLKAQALAMNGDGGANDLIDEARLVARRLGDGRLLARAAMVRFGFGVPPDRTAAMIELAEPLDLLDDAAPERIELLSAAAVIVTVLEQGDAVDALLAAARRTYEATGDARTEAVWLAARSIADSVSGRDRSRAATMADRAYELASSCGDSSVVAAAIHAVIRTAYDQGDLDRVDHLTDHLERSSAKGLLPFGVVRTHLCRATNSIARGQLADAAASVRNAAEIGRRMGTHAAGSATQLQQLLIALEAETLDEYLDLLRALAVDQVGSAATAALVGDSGDLAHLRATMNDAVHDDSLAVVAALASWAAVRHGDVEVARWARPHLVELGEATVQVGFGTLVLGFATFFVGLCDRAVGDTGSACDRFRRAVELSDAVGASLSSAHARLWLAETLLDLDAAGSDVEACDLIGSVEAVVPRVGSHLVELEARQRPVATAAAVTGDRERSD